jgi:uncharacterized protein (TIGR02217 family)
MSSQIYPTLPGLDAEVKRSYVWKSGIQEALSGKQSAISYRQYPLIAYELTYNVLRRNISPDEFQSIVGLYNDMKGRFDTFLFTDPDFNTITAGNAAQYGIFGTGDGATLIFQLIATLQNSGGPGGAEIIQNLNGTPVLYDNGSVISAANYSIGATGVVTFGAGHAPVSGHTLTWSGSWYNRCRFDEDAIVWTKIMPAQSLWKASVKFGSVKL